jgi:hypothetical protein
MAPWPDPGLEFDVFAGSRVLSLANNMTLLGDLADWEPIILSHASHHNLFFPFYRYSFLFLVISSVVPSHKTALLPRRM